jgi:hypothetical protein
MMYKVGPLKRSLSCRGRIQEQQVLLLPVRKGHSL